MLWFLSVGMITVNLFGLAKPQLVYKKNKILSRIVRLVSVLTLVCAMLAILAGCGTANKTGGEFNFNAKILEINNKNITVEPMEGESILRSADKIVFGYDGLDDIAASVGDIVTITYTGDIMESYPAQINAVSWSIFEKLEQ